MPVLMVTAVVDSGCLRGRGKENKRGTTCMWGGGGDIFIVMRDILSIGRASSRAI